jgi:hypothetical protein
MHRAVDAGTSLTMDADNAKIAEVESLLWQMRDGTLDPDRKARLESLVIRDPEVRRFYIRYSMLCGGLRWLNAGAVNERREFDAKLPEPMPYIVVDPSSLSSLSSPLSGLGGLLFSYMVSAVILGVAMLGAWTCTISRDYRNVVVSPAPNDKIFVPPESEFIGRVTGMMDCRWADPLTQTFLGASVPLERRYALAAGLMEITYDSGTKVILQGPCTYKVKSSNSGFLARGKLTARIGERGEGRGESAKPQSAHLRISKSPNPQSISPLSPLPSPLFTVHTPTAVITDLGTEFGVEVDQFGATRSHVFQGKVEIRTVGGKNLTLSPEQGADGAGSVIQLVAGESARVQQGTDAAGPLLSRYSAADKPPTFQRWLIEPPKILDILDIVAGGNGLGSRRERGIDPTNGMEDIVYLVTSRCGNGKYQPTFRKRFIDGVFLPNGNAGQVQLDSAGHAFGGFPATTGTTVGGIWARAADIQPNGPLMDRWNWAYSMGRGEQFMPDRRGLLCMHANAGITLDLAAMRKMYPGSRPARFRATAGLADAAAVLADVIPYGMVDLWIFVDGRLMFKRQGLEPKDGAVAVNVELGSKDRFLTIVVTDGDARANYDWAVFGDPVLDMIPTNPENR